MGGKTKRVPWWNVECTEAIKERNTALRILRNNLNQVNINNYQKKKAIARKVIKKNKKSAWRDYCSTIGREIKIDVWKMLKKMSGKKVFTKISVLEDGEVLAITDKEKADLLGKAFASVHSGDHLDEKHKQRKKEIVKENKIGMWIERKKDSEGSTMDAEITMNELIIGLDGAGNTATGEDQLS